MMRLTLPETRAGKTLSPPGGGEGFWPAQGMVPCA